MVQTITARSDGTVDVNTGTHSLSDGLLISAELQIKLESLCSRVKNRETLEVHSERDGEVSFEHVVTEEGMTENNFGTFITTEEFDWIVNTIDTALTSE